MDNNDVPVVKKKTMFFFSEIGLMMPAWALFTVEKDEKWETKPKTHMVYGIIINGGMESAQGNPVGEKSIWFDKINERDKKFNLLIDKMNDVNYNVINL